MTPNRHGTAVVDYPSDLEIRITRKFDAPIQLVFDVSTKEEHLRHTLAPFGEEVKECTVDLRVGGDYRFTFVSDDGADMTFTGTFLEIDPPTHSMQTWRFHGWPDDSEAVESMDLSEADGVTTLTYRLAFRTQAGRDQMKDVRGLLANFDNEEDYLRSLLQA